MEISKKGLLAIVAELAETNKKVAGSPKEMTNKQLVAAILNVTDDGKNTKGLSKETRAVVVAMANGDITFPAAPGAAKNAAPKTEKAPASKPKKPAKAEADESDEAEENDPPEVEEPAGIDGVDLGSDEMVAAAEDLVEVLALDTHLVVDGKVKKGRFVKACSLLRPSDNLTKTTWALLKELKLGPEPKAPKGKAPKASDARKAGKKVNEPGEKGPENRNFTRYSAKETTKDGKAKTVIGTIKEYVDRYADNGKVLDRGKLADYVISEHPEHERPELLAARVDCQIPSRFTADRGYRFEEAGPDKFKVFGPKTAPKKNQEREKEKAPASGKKAKKK